MRQLVKTFKALSDPNRIRILKMLEVEELCVCEITEILHLATSTVSKHLSLLRDAEFIIDRKEGKWVYYRLNDTGNNDHTRQILPIIKNTLNEDPTVIADKEKSANIDREALCHI